MELEEEVAEALNKVHALAGERLPFRGAEKVAELLDQIEQVWTEWGGVE